MMRAIGPLLTLSLLMLIALPLHALAGDFAPSAEANAKKCRRSFAAGLANLGIQARKGFMKHYSAEIHYLVNFEDANDSELTANVFGLRGYRHFRAERRLQYYAGMEADYLLAKTRFQSANGYSAGGFAGLEYYLTSRLSLGFDLGPYYVWLKEKDFGISGGGVDFVLHSYLNYYIF